jgi:serine protease Do
VTTGVISAKERALPGSYSHYLQVDAPINPGNSGGPLANLNGQVVGINNAIQANAQGIGFAIPINLVKGALPQLKTKGHIERGYIGINIEDLRPDLARTLKIDTEIRAPIITNVIRNAPAEKAGLQAYDVVLEANGKPVHSTTELVSIITNVTLGDKVKLKVLRQGKEHELNVQVAKRPLEGSE